MVEAKRTEDWNHTARLCTVLQLVMSSKDLSKYEVAKLFASHHPTMEAPKPPKADMKTLKAIFCGQKRQGNPSGRSVR